MKDAANPWYEVTLIEGKNRQIRRMFEEIGHHVEKIKRVRYGPLTLDVAPGEFRELSPGEIAGLRRAVRGDKPSRPEGKPPTRSKASDRRKEHGRARPRKNTES
jgi:23S rRNA pseudouridine2605 synthase